MDHKEALCPHGDCMNPLNMANKSITIYFSLLYLTVVPLLLLWNWHLSSNCLGGIFNVCFDHFFAVMSFTHIHLKDTHTWRVLLF